MESFGVFLTMDTLTNGDLTKHDEYFKLPARLVYNKLLLEKVRGDYQRDLQRIKEMKANGNK